MATTKNPEPEPTTGQTTDQRTADQKAADQKSGQQESRVGDPTPNQDRPEWQVDPAAEERQRVDIEADKEAAREEMPKR